jgi:copper transport protein
VKRALAAVALLAALAPANAAAHATVRGTVPSFREELASGPSTVRIRFDQRVSVPTIRVLDSRGRNLARGAARVDDGGVVVRVASLPRGAYTVRWRVLSADSHTVAGVFTFGVRVPAPAPTDAYGSQGPTRTEHVVRWLYFLGLALLLGSLAFRLVCLRGVSLPPGVDRRLALLGGIGVVGVLEVGILAFCLRAEDALQLPFGEFLYGDLSPIAGGTRFGTAFVAMTLGYALVAALLFLAWLTDRPRILVPAFVVALGFASGLSLSGHSAVDAGASWKSQLADWVHLSAASVWLGGLLSMVVAVWPLAPGLRRTAFARFSRLATALVGLLVLAGVYLSILRLPHVSDLWDASYGRVLLVKLGLVSIALAWGAFHHFVVRPALARGSDRFAARVGRSLAGEAVVGLAVLLAAAVLVDSKPPPQPASPGQVETRAAAR